MRFSKKMAFLWTLLVFLASLQLVQLSDNLFLTTSGSGDIHQEYPDEKPVHVGFDNMFNFDLSKEDMLERKKREIEGNDEQDAEVLSWEPGTSVDVQLMPLMTTLNDLEPSSGEKELEEDQDKNLSDVEDNIEFNAEESPKEVEVEGNEDEEEKDDTKGLPVVNTILDSIESSVDNDNNSSPGISKEAQVNVLPSEINPGLSESHIVPTVLYLDQTKENEDDVKVQASGKETSVNDLDVNDSDEKDPIEKEDTEPEIMGTEDEVEVLSTFVKSSEKSPLAHLKQSDDEGLDEDSVESGSGTSDDFSGFNTTIDEILIAENGKKNDEKTPILSPANDLLNVESDDIDEEENEKEKTPTSDPDFDSLEPNPSNTDIISVESNDNNEEENPIPDPTSNSSDLNASAENVSHLQSGVLDKFPDTSSVINIAGSGDDNSEEANVAIEPIEKDPFGDEASGSDSDQETPIPNPIESDPKDIFVDIDNSSIENPGDGDETPIPKPLEDVSESHSPVNEDKDSANIDVHTIMGNNQSPEKDSRILPIPFEIQEEGSGDISDDDEEQDVAIPPLLSRGVNSLGSSPKDHDFDGKIEGPHEKSVIGELPEKKDDGEVIVIPDINKQIPNPILTIDEKNEAESLPGDKSNVLEQEATSENGKVSNDSSGINEVGVKTDEKENHSETTSASYGSYIVLAAILIVIFGLLLFTFIKNRRQKKQQRKLSSMPMDSEDGTELKEIETLLSRDNKNRNGPDNIFGETDGLLSLNDSYNGIPLSKMFYPAKRPDVPNGLASHSDLPLDASSPKTEIKFPAELSEVTVESVPPVFERVPIMANGGKLIQHMTPTDSDNASDDANDADDDSSDERGSWVYGNIPLDTTKIKMFIDQDSIPKTPIIVVKRGGNVVEM